MPCLKPPKREGECAPSVRKGRCWVALHWAGTARTTSPLDGDARTCTTEPEETKHPILQRRRLVAERSSVRGWQDLRAVYSQTAVCGAFRMHGAHILPKPAHFGYTAAICCHELAIFPSEATFGIHGAQNLPRIAARGRISRAFFHRQTPGNAPRRNLATARPPENAPREYIATASQAKSALGLPATAGRWRTHFASILPSSSARERISATSCQQSGIFVRAGLLPCHSSRTA